MLESDINKIVILSLETIDKLLQKVCILYYRVIMLYKIAMKML